MRYRLAFNRMASALRLAGSIYVSLHYCPVKAGKSVFEIVET